jgi:hypothetical protein
MFIAHFGVALAAKKAAPKRSLGTLVMAAQFLDLLWPLFLLLGVEHVRIHPGDTPITPLDFYDYPISHSLVGALVWAVVLGSILYLVRRSKRDAVVIGLCVFSHWVLDWIAHRSDLPLSPWSSLHFGLGLWYSVPATVVTELLLFSAGLFIYLRTTKAKDRLGAVNPWLFGVVLLILWLGNTFGPPPPSVDAIKYAGNGLWLFVIWAYWIDKHREVQVPVT